MLVPALLAERLEHGLSAQCPHLVPEHQLNRIDLYLFEVRRIALHGQLHLLPEELGGGDSQVLALLPVNTQELLGGVVVVLDLFLRSHCGA